MLPRFRSACLFALFVLSTSGVLAENNERPRLGERIRAHANAGVLPEVEQKVIVGNDSRSYLLFNASRGAPAPLMIVLHGGGGNGGSMIQRWHAKAQSEGLIIAAPNGSGRTAKMGTWNVGGCCGEAMSNRVDDVHFVAQVIAEVTRTTNVDRNRIYVTGMSNGGMLTHRVAIALSDQLAGAAVVAGAMFGDEPPPRSPVPMLIMHGMADSVVGFEGGMSPTRFVARAQSKPFKPAADSVEFWRKANGCSTLPAITINGDVTIESNTVCRDNSAVVFYRLTSADHTWPGKANDGAPQLEKSSYREIDATDVIWDFFKTRHRNGATKAGQ